MNSEEQGFVEELNNLLIKYQVGLVPVNLGHDDTLQLRIQAQGRNIDLIVEDHVKMGNKFQLTKKLVWGHVKELVNKVRFYRDSVTGIITNCEVNGYPLSIEWKLAGKDYCKIVLFIDFNGYEHAEYIDFLPMVDGAYYWEHSGYQKKIQNNIDEFVITHL